MNVLTVLTEFFINAFQITRPAPEQQRRVELILGGSVLAAILLAIGVLIGFLVWAFHA